MLLVNGAADTNRSKVNMTTDFSALIPSAPKGRFEGITRNYTPADVLRLRGSVMPASTLAERGANKLWAM